MRPLGSDADKVIGSMKLGTAGGVILNPSVLSNGEVCMDGPPLMSAGKTVRIGGWSFWWLPEFGPCIALLSKDDQRRINEIASGCVCVRPIVIDDIPYLNDDQADKLRTSLQVSGKTLSFSCSNDGKFSSWVQERKNCPSLWFLGSKDHVFDGCFEDRNFRFLCTERFHGSDLDRNAFKSKWINKSSVEQFVISLLSGFKLPNVDETQEESCDEVSKVVCPTQEESCDEVSSDKNESDVNSGVTGTTSSEDDIPEKVVSFGVDEVIEFSYEDRESELVNSRGFKATSSTQVSLEFDHHLLTHFPSKRDCEVCKSSKRRHKGFVRGSASGKDFKDPFLVCDWVNPRVVATDGSKYCLVIGWVQKDVCLVFPSKVKKGTVVGFLDKARKEWGISSQSYVFHSDNERVLGSVEVLKYLEKNGEDPGGVLWNGVPHAKNSNAFAESYVKRVEDGTRCLLTQSGLPVKMWQHAAVAFGVCDCWSKGVELRINKCKPLPSGCRGEGVLPKGLLFKDKFESRVTNVCNLGVDTTSSGGFKVLFMGANGKFRRSVVMNRDVRWFPSEMCFERTKFNLRNVVKAIPGMECENKVSPHQAQVSV